MAITVANDMVSVQILLDAIRGVFKGKNAFMGSVLVSSGAVLVSGTMPKGGAGAVGKTVDIPYFGTLGTGFVNNPDGSAITPQKIQQTSETATVGRRSLAVETSAWAQGLAQVDPSLGDPHQEAANQAMVLATRAMDEIVVTEAATTPLIYDATALTGDAQFLNHRTTVRARSKWGDDQESIVAMVTHSQSEADLAELTDGNGRPLLTEPLASEGQGSFRKLGGVPLLISDKVPLTGSTMGTVTGAGTSAPVGTLTGTPSGPWNLKIACVLGGAHATATFKFSTDNGQTWSANITTVGAASVIPLVDTNIDSLVGNNGQTGLSVAFAAGTFNADNTWVSTASLVVSTMILQKGAVGFWYAASRLGSKSDVDILSDADIIAMHLYNAPKLYRRRNGGSRAGCVLIKHKVRNYQG